jgi:hypothetical protein
LFLMKTMTLALAVIAVMALVGCGGGSSLNLDTPAQVQQVSTGGASPLITAWAVVAAHTGVGDVAIPAADNYIEARDSGISRIKVTFPGPMSPGGPSAVSIVGLGGDQSGLVSNLLWSAGNTVVEIALSAALPDQDAYRVTLRFKNLAGYPLSDNHRVMASLKGDVNSSGAVSGIDSRVLAAQIGKAVGPTTARYDMNLDGAINGFDTRIVGQYMGHALPAKPWVFVDVIAPLPPFFAEEGSPGAIELVGVQKWTVVGDTLKRPVQLVANPASAVTLTRVAPGTWRAEALLSWQCDVTATCAGKVYWSSHVVTTHIFPDKLEIFVDGATKTGDTTFDGGKTDLVTPVTLSVSWIDHGAVGYPGWPGSPNIPILWDVPAGLIVSVLGDKNRHIEVRARRTGAGPQTLTGDVAGKKFTVTFLAP